MLKQIHELLQINRNSNIISYLNLGCVQVDLSSIRCHFFILLKFGNIQTFANWQLPVSSENLKALQLPSVSSANWHIEAHESRDLLCPLVLRAVVQLPEEKCKRLNLCNSPFQVERDSKPALWNVACLAVQSCRGLNTINVWYNN